MAVKNPKLFREMSEPHSSHEELQAATDAFFDDVQAARAKHRLRNVAVVVETSFLNADEEEVATLGVLTVGDRTQAQSMFAYGYGAMRVEQEEMIGRLLRGKRNSHG